MKTVAVIGAGAAGCFCAIELKRRRPELAVTVFEAGPKALAKVAVTGGGRCNFTNTFAGISRLEEAYPRGAQLMKRALRAFSQDDVMSWFASEGVPYVIQDDQCVFPASQDAMQIVRTLESLLRRLGITLHCRSRVDSLTYSPSTSTYHISLAAPSSSAPSSSLAGPSSSLVGPSSSSASSALPAATLSFDAVVVTTGGGALKLLDPLELAIEKPVPSLFTLKIDNDSLKSLMGLVVADASLAIAGTPFRSRGPLLLTDWGVSGPATLKLSSYAARWLADASYRGILLVNWLSWTEADARSFLSSCISTSPRKRLSSIPPSPLPSRGSLSSGSPSSFTSRDSLSSGSPSSFSSRDSLSSGSPALQQRLWAHLIAKAGLREDIVWGELGTKGVNRLVNTLTADEYPIVGRCHFKSEFVTCGGVSLSEVSLKTLESKRYPGLYFAGEVLDLDAITGGFNLQAAWSTAMLIAQSF